MTALQTERMSGKEQVPVNTGLRSKNKCRCASWRVHAADCASVRKSRLRVTDAETDPGLDPLMALPETAEFKHGKQQDSHCNWRLPWHRSSRGPGLSRSRL